MSLPVAAAGSLGAAAKTAAVAGTRSDVVNFDNGANTVQSTLASGRPVTLATPKTPSASVSPGMHPNIPVAPAAGCGAWSVVKNYYALKQTFMNLYSWSGGSGEVDETSGSSHTLGVGGAVTGGSWSISGTLTKTATSADESDETHTHHLQLSNEVDAAHYAEYCWHTGGVDPYYRHKIAATHFYSLQSQQTVINMSSDISYGWCTYYSQGYHTKTSGSNIDFTKGFAAPFINLSSQSSYSSNVSVKYHITSPSYLCGSNDGWAYARNAGTKNAAVGCSRCQITNRSAIPPTIAAKLGNS